MYDEAGYLSEVQLKKKMLSILPQASLMRDAEYKRDYTLAIAE